MKPTAIHISIAVFILGIVGANPTYALNEETHEVVNEQATRQSQLDQVLKTQLGFREGIEQPVNGRAVFRWLRDGGKQEDSPLCRTARHFHNPLYQADGSGIAPWDGTWADAGLSTGNLFIGITCGAFSFPSSIHWAQDPDQTPGAPAAWQTARDQYYLALTASDPATREQAFAETFKILGQQMHLVADASVPEHVRNDPHLLESVCRKLGFSCYGSYEWWLTDEQTRSESSFIQKYLAAADRPDSAILQEATEDDLAAVPIARLVDTDTYDGTDPNVTRGSTIGIAEVAHANFSSEDTGRGQYPFPDVSRLVTSEHLAPKTGRVRAYYAKGAGDGIPVDPVLAACVLDQAAVDAGIAPTYGMCTDENVWAEVARELLPRAVGYSAALLDYFFRGKIEAWPETIGWDENTGDQIWAFRVANRTVVGAMTGTLELYYEAPDGTRRLLTSWPLSLEAGEERQGFRFPRPALDAALDGYLLVFRGQLGTEPEAVVGARTGLRYIVYMTYTSTGLGETIIWHPLAGDGGQNFFGGEGRESASISKDDYGRVVGQSGFNAHWIYYRSLYLLPGETATLDVAGYCLTFIRSYWWTGRDDQYIYSSVTGEVVELEEPRDWAALLAYSPAQFIVKRFLYSYSGMGIVTFDVDIGRGRFFGVRVTPPSPPELTPDEWVGYTDCYLWAGFRNLR